MLRCAITDGRYQTGNACRWAEDGVDFVQLRDKKLDAAHLLHFARSILKDIAAVPNAITRLLINDRGDVAIAASAAGVHLTAHPDELTPTQVREIFAIGKRSAPVLSVSCHTIAEVERARDAAVDFILFGPVFEKCIGGELVSAGVGLEMLREACIAAGTTKVLALGGVTRDNTNHCIEAGAEGVAGIRLFA
jgi:thiamine-phosphate pyrophosphorylase